MKAWLRKALGVDELIEAAVEAAVEEAVESTLNEAAVEAVGAVDSTAEEWRDEAEGFKDDAELAQGAAQKAQEAAEAARTEANNAGAAFAIGALEELEKALSINAAAQKAPGPVQEALNAVTAAVAHARRQV